MRIASIIAVWASGTLSTLAFAGVEFGPYTFVEDAFADMAFVNDSGNLRFNNATTLDEALLGFSPGSGLFNIGNEDEGNAGDFTLLFTDFIPVDGPGADIVLFDARFSQDPYEVALVTQSGETDFLAFPVEQQVFIGFVPGLDISGDVVAIEIDLADYGISTARGIRFRSLPNEFAVVEGDPLFAGVINGIPSPSAAVVVVVGGLLASRRRR